LVGRWACRECRRRPRGYTYTGYRMPHAALRPRPSCGCGAGPPKTTSIATALSILDFVALAHRDGGQLTRPSCSTAYACRSAKYQSKTNALALVLLSSSPLHQLLPARAAVELDRWVCCSRLARTFIGEGEALSSRSFVTFPPPSGGGGVDIVGGKL